MAEATLQILTLRQDKHDVLSKVCQYDLDIPTFEELAKYKDVSQQLNEALIPVPTSAGLAAPQIGISEPVFIFSWDRTPEHRQVAYKPSFTPLSETKKMGWEGCLSVLLEKTGPYKIAKVPRHESIRVTFYNEEGNLIQQDLIGFAARVFQHEYDHLQGTICVNHSEAEETKTFDTEKELDDFMQAVKKENSIEYIAPKVIKLS